MKAVNVNGNEVAMEVAVNLMDDEIRETLHNAMAECEDQEFVDAYCAAHKEKFGEVFTAA